MRAPRLLLALLAATALGGCATSWNDRFTSNWDSALDLFQRDATSQAMWPEAYPSRLPPLSTQKIPVRKPEPGVPQPGWPPLAPALDGASAETGPTCSGECDTEPRATAADLPDPPVSGERSAAR